jgi:hypothetical protein
MDGVLEDLRRFIAYRVREGFRSVHDIVENATSYALETHGRDDLQPVIKRFVAELLAEHRAEQSGWEWQVSLPDMTDRRMLDSCDLRITDAQRASLLVPNPGGHGLPEHG